MITLNLLLLLAAITSTTQSNHDFNHKTLLFRPQSSPRSRSSLPWRYLERQESLPDSNESTPDSTSSSSEVQPVVPQQPEEQSEETSSSVEVPPKRIQIVRSPTPPQKGESGTIVVKKLRPVIPVESEEDDVQDDRDLAPAANDFITFSYYPISQVYDNSGSVVYEIQDEELRTARGGWGKGKKKKGCKKGKKGKKGRSKKKGKKKKGGCKLKGGWWYYYDKKHGYVSGRWGTPPPKGLEREHYWHNYGKHGHNYGKGYRPGTSYGIGAHGHHGGWGHHGGGYGGGGGGFGGFGGGYGGHGGHHGHHGHGGWGWKLPETHYGWGWAQKHKGWGGWR